MITAKPISLNVRPFQVSNLCFEIGGILGESFMELGSKVSAFDFGRFYTFFRAAEPANPAAPGRLRFDSDGIDALTKSTQPPVEPNQPPVQFALAALRAETVKAALNKAVNARANAFITKYGNVAGIVEFLRSVQPATNIQLARISNLSEAMAKGIRDAYEAANQTGVLKATKTVVKSTLTNKGSSSSSTKGPGVDEIQTSTSEEGDTTTELQDHENFGFEFRFPHLENLMRNERLQASLCDERVSHFMKTHFLDRIEEVFQNELASIDIDVNQLQVAYLNTLLMSPIDGIVTGVYKNPGDPVSPGEPVFRVENNAEVLIVARVICRGPISIGAILQVKTTLFDSPDAPLVIEAPIVAARGQGEDDQWEVIAKRSNIDAVGKSIFPLGYNFDYDNTEVAILGAGEI